MLWYFRTDSELDYQSVQEMNTGVYYRCYLQGRFTIGLRFCQERLRSLYFYIRICLNI